MWFRRKRQNIQAQIDAAVLNERQRIMANGIDIARQISERISLREHYEQMLKANEHNFSPVGNDYTRQQKIEMTCHALNIDYDRERAAVSGENRRIVVQMQRGREHQDRRTKSSHINDGRKRSVILHARQALVDVNECAYCGHTFIDDYTPSIWHMDHVVPLRKGGADDLHNIVKACKWCNMSKGVKVWVPLHGVVYADGKTETRHGGGAPAYVVRQSSAYAVLVSS
jgi:5-methylcytosine-specific restriction endonuclease McrA